MGRGSEGGPSTAAAPRPTPPRNSSPPDALTTALTPPERRLGPALSSFLLCVRQVRFWDAPSSERERSRWVRIARGEYVGPQLESVVRRSAHSGRTSGCRSSYVVLVSACAFRCCIKITQYIWFIGGTSSRVPRGYEPGGRGSEASDCAVDQEVQVTIGTDLAGGLRTRWLVEIVALHANEGGVDSELGRR